MVILKDIPGLEGFYQASNDGHIYSVRSKKFLKESGNEDYRTEKAIKKRGLIIPSILLYIVLNCYLCWSHSKVHILVTVVT